MSTRRNALAAAVRRFTEVLNAAQNDIVRDAAIQRFEFCFELAWKSVQEKAREEGLDCQSPKGCLQLAFKNSWIDDEQGWLAMLQDRNRTTHTYDEAVAKAVFERLAAYLPLFHGLLEKLKP